MYASAARTSISDPTRTHDAVVSKDTGFASACVTESPPDSLSELSGTRDRNTAVTAAACIGCRSKHLKCDGMSICSRCISHGLQCVYIKSRRGFKKGGKKEDKDTHAEVATENSTISLEVGSEMMASHCSPGPSKPLSFDFSVASQSWGVAFSRYDSPRKHQPQCVEAFFQYFYFSHPFLPPRQHFLEAMKTSPVDILETAMCYVGARYIPGASVCDFAAELDAFMSRLDLPNNESTVQTMLLFVIGLNGNNEQRKAVDILIRAQKLALAIGMNHAEFSRMNGKGSVFYEESLRRTWWELYVVSIMMAGFHGTQAFRLSGVVQNVPLPCEDSQFVSGYVPPLHTIADYDETDFLEEETLWSSLTYRIAAARNLERVLFANEATFSEDFRTFNLDTYLVNWELHLPPAKMSCFNDFGNFDEMMFQAHMITNLSSLLLHQRFAMQDEAIIPTIAVCAEQLVTAKLEINTSSLHSSKASQAASSISKLVTFPTPLTHHTHFFICALTLSSINHLSRWSNSLPMIADDDLRQEILMNMGALNALRRVWPVAEAACEQVTKAARVIFERRKHVAGDAFWRELMDENDTAGMIRGPMSAC